MKNIDIVNKMQAKNAHSQKEIRPTIESPAKSVQFVNKCPDAPSLRLGPNFLYWS